jgi:membrane-associated phospholipid phosphatase
MRQFFSTLPENIIGSFKGRMIIGHLFAIGITALLVLSGFDAHYFSATRNPVLFSWAFSAAPIGGLVPLMLPLALFLLGIMERKPKITLTGWAIAQAGLIGSLISSAYKAVTGRVHPPLAIGPEGITDSSHDFRFGLFRGGIFWGWPSSHTTIAFAMAFTVFTLFRRNKYLGTGAIIYAFYIGIGVSMTIHWFSDFLAGAMIGTMIGLVVGKSFSTQAVSAFAVRA